MRIGAHRQATLWIAILSLGACSSRPREFSPTLAAATVDERALQVAVSDCRQLLVEGKLNAHGQLASGGAGAAAGAATAAVGSTAAAAVGGWSGLAVASATVVLLPFAALGGAWGLAKAKKRKKERAVQQAMAGCLNERGFAVVGWTPAKKDRSRGAAQPPA